MAASETEIIRLTHKFIVYSALFYMPLSDLIVTSYPFVYAKEDIDDCIEWIKDYSEDSIPALDENNRLLGVITAQDIVKVVDDEMGEDYAMLAGLTSEEDLHEPLNRVSKNVCMADYTSRSRTSCFICCRNV